MLRSKQLCKVLNYKDLSTDIISGVENCLDFKYSLEGTPPDTIAFNDDDCSKDLLYICEGTC